MKMKAMTRTLKNAILTIKASAKQTLLVQITTQKKNVNSTLRMVIATKCFAE
jgi:hypothetical protein